MYILVARCASGVDRKRIVFAPCTVSHNHLRKFIIPFQINPWLTSLGYSLCYGTILVKTVRIWFIFNKPQVLSLTRSVRDDNLVPLLHVDTIIIVKHEARKMIVRH